MSRKQTRILATLVRGQSYRLKTGPESVIVFERGTAIEVTKAQRDHLEKHAVDQVTLPGRSDDEQSENRRYPKFAFKEAKDERATD